MTSQIVPLDAREDPCLQKNCDANSYCQVQDDVARCVCQPGTVNPRHLLSVILNVQVTHNVL